MIYLCSKLDSHQCGATEVWEILYKEHTSWPECVTSKSDDIIKFLLLVFKKNFVVYDKHFVQDIKSVVYSVKSIMKEGMFCLITYTTLFLEMEKEHG